LNNKSFKLSFYSIAMERNNWFKRELEIEEALEERIDTLFGEDFLYRLSNVVDRIVEIETSEYLGLKKPSSTDVMMIDYVRVCRGLRRFRMEESCRILLEVDWLLAFQKTEGNPQEADLRDVAQVIKDQIVDLDDFGIRRSLDRRYYGEKN
jgi:hypothetical protein